MQAKNADSPKDLISLLEENLKAGKPLLQDAMLYRGTQQPDQASSSYASSSMHSSLLLQVASSYTNNWKDAATFIGSYKIDREETRFFKDFGIEQHMEGKKMPSMSVKEAEQFLEPYVKAVASAVDSRSRGRAEDRLEMAVKRNLYEAAVPTRTAEKEPNRPVDLYIYNGRPDIAIRQAVGMQMKKVGPHNEAQVKAVLAKEQKNPVIRQIHQLSFQRTPTTSKALNVLKDIAQRDFGNKMLAEHGTKPLNKMMDAVAKQPLSPDQERLGRFAKALVEGESHPNPAISGKATAIMSELAKLDGSKATFQDVAKVSAAVSSKFAAAEAGAGKQLDGGKQMAGGPQLEGAKQAEASKAPAPARSAAAMAR
jgi:hypothetical protein